jgi:hypothetical protein
MKRGAILLVRLSIILFSFLLIEGGKTYIQAGTDIHSIFDHKHNHDLEIPDIENFNKLADIELWIDSENIKITIPDLYFPNITYYQNFKSQDFSKSIWQPPKFN